jgi:RNA polymerase sigma-70 factor, ECF subfamily
MIDRQDFERSAIPQMNMLHNYALHLTMNSENARDLLQETYLKAYRFWNKYELGTNVKGWLCQIMKNSYINIYRKKSKEPRSIEYDENYCSPRMNQSLQFQPNNLKSKYYTDLFVDDIVLAINSLPETFRIIVLLKDVDDLSYEEIALTINCPIGTVRSRLHRGRKHLQKRLINYVRNNNYISSDRII